MDLSHCLLLNAVFFTLMFCDVHGQANIQQDVPVSTQLQGSQYYYYYPIFQQRVNPGYQAVYPYAYGANSYGYSPYNNYYGGYMQQVPNYYPSSNSYPYGNVDPYVNIPTEIIDVDENDKVIDPKKPQYQWTQSKSMSENTQYVNGKQTNGPIVIPSRSSNVVFTDTKPIDIKITRTIKPNGEVVTQDVDNLGKDNNYTFLNGKIVTEASISTTEPPSTTTEKESEEVKSVRSWFA